ncbi:hypothetical protein QMA77_06840 [Pantoea ananatis]|uniref:hypothetical protein n=1 Tax=Pantoea ananas TaxID=553 RepID=UPI0024AE479F|nr:hypothetical protein [Pantoea ananatis]MDI6536652.1 hypothetical protein [Pantoea ananatis]
MAVTTSMLRGWLYAESASLKPAATQAQEASRDTRRAHSARDRYGLPSALRSVQKAIEPIPKAREACTSPMLEADNRSQMHFMPGDFNNSIGYLEPAV